MNKELTKKFAPGHGTCAGCGIPTIVRTVLDATDDPVVVINATGCLEVTSTLYPYTAWKVPYIHNAFENAPATAAGVEAAYPSLKRQGKIKGNIKFVVFGGDGSTYDIGLQALSGMLERGHDVLYVGYDNQGYMNTGGQRSGATPIGASMETTPSGKESYGNKIPRKDIIEIVKGHHIEYIAQSNTAYIEDIKKKAKKGFETEGPAFLLVFQPCTNVWKFPTSQYVNIGKLAVETNFWPLFEIEDGKYTLNIKNENPKKIEEFMKTQKRFKHLMKPANKGVVKNIQADIDKKWKELNKRAE